ncbi:MAG: hypothetical protein R3F24_13785 [Gammaproteobacteria bacterium]
MVQINEQPPSLGTAEVADGIGAVVSAGKEELLRRDQQGISQAGGALSIFRNTAAEQFDQLTTAAPLGGGTSTQDFLQWFDTEATKMVDDAPTPRTKDYLAAQLATERGRFEAEGRAFLQRAELDKVTVEQSTVVDQGQLLLRRRPEAFADLLAEQEAYLQTTGLPAMARESLRTKARELLAVSAVETLAERDPSDTLQRLRADVGQSGVEAIEALSPQSRDRAINLAETEIRRREAEARSRQVEARMIAATQVAALKDYMGDAQQRFSMGFGLDPGYGDARQAILNLPDDTPQKADLLRKDAVLSTLDNSGFMQLPPQEQADAITALEARMQTDANAVDVDILRTARSVQAETERVAKADPFRFAIQRGVIQPPQQTDDPAADLKARAVAGLKVSQYLGKDVPGFTVSELANLGERYTNGSVDDRLGILAGITDSHGQEQASTVFAAMDKQGQSGMAFAGALMMDDPQAARLVVRGQKALQEGGKAGGVLIPKPDDINRGISDLLGDAYGLGTSARATVEDAVKAAYAAESVDAGDTKGDLVDDRLDRAVHAVTGGLIEYQGRTMPTPKRGVTQAQFSLWAETLQPEDFSKVAGLTPGVALQAFKRDGWLEAVGPNQYVPVITGPDGRDRFWLLRTDRC